MRRTYPSDALPMAEWQRRRNLQLGGGGSGVQAGAPSVTLTDNLPMSEWQRARTLQVQGGDSASPGRGDDALAGGNGTDKVRSRKGASKAVGPQSFFGAIGDAARAATGFVGRQVQAFGEAQMEGERLQREQERAVMDAAVAGGRRIVEALHPGGTPKPAPTPTPQAAVPRAPVPLTKREAARDFGAGVILDRLAQGEGTGEASGYDTTFGYGKFDPPDRRAISAMTLDELAQFQKEMLTQRSGSSAVGRYQINHQTAGELRKRMGLTGSEVFTPELQDRMARERLRMAGWDNYLAGKLTLDELQTKLAGGWASVAKPDGRSYHDQPVGTTSDQIRSAIEQGRAEAEHLRDLGEDPSKPAWR